ncbi:hypothetical protein N9Y26_01470 [bacterium]|nr:hypothetical protein [bacterium]
MGSKQGLIAIMLAQRFSESNIQAIEIDKLTKYSFCPTDILPTALEIKSKFPLINSKNARIEAP